MDHTMVPLLLSYVLPIVAGFIIGYWKFSKTGHFHRREHLPPDEEFTEPLNYEGFVSKSKYNEVVRQLKQYKQLVKQ